MSKFTTIERGARQGCVFSPDMFNWYGETILRCIEGMPGISIGGYNLNNLRYADDTVLISDSQEGLQALLDKVVDASKDKGLTLNCKKTECMVVSKNKDNPKCELRSADSIIKQVTKFNYLGSMITSDIRSD